MRVLVAFLFLLLVSVLSARQPTREELGDVESLANHFVQRRFAQAHGYFSPSLAAHWTKERLQSFRARMDEVGGRLRHVQAARGLEGDVPEYAFALVPVDFENGTFDLFFTWSGEFGAGMLTDFRIRTRQPARPSPEAIASGVNDIPFPDAVYVNRELFDESPMQVGARTPALPAMVAVPRGNASARYPAIVLLGERWALDENGAVGPNRPLQDIAHGLASRGVVTLRFRPRIMTEEALQSRAYTLDDLILADVEAAVRLLAEHPAVDSRRLYIMGHELGAVAAAEMAKRLPGLHGVILLAPPASYDAPAHLARLELHAEKGLPPGEQELRMLRGTLQGIEQRQFDPAIIYHDAPASFWYHVAGFRPIESLRRYKGEVFFLFAEHDYTVDREVVQLYADFAKNREAMRGRLLPGLNHWFMASQGPDPLEIDQPSHVDRSMIDAVLEFLDWSRERARTGQRATRLL